jgi:hypothetical protein
MADIEGDLKAAISSRDPDTLTFAVAAAEAAGATDSPIFAEARALAQSLTAEKEVSSALREALATKNLASLKAAVAKADEYNLTESDEYATATELAANIETVMADLEEAQNAGGDVNAILERAIALGLDGAELASMRDQMLEQQDVLSLLPSAIESRDVNVLRSVVNRGRKCQLTTHPLFQEASALFEDLESEEEAREQELNAAGEDDNYEVGEGEEDFAHYDHQGAFERSAFADDGFRWTKCKTIRTPNDFTKGVFMSKGSVKQSMLRFTKKVRSFRHFHVLCFFFCVVYLCRVAFCATFLCVRTAITVHSCRLLIGF